MYVGATRAIEQREGTKQNKQTTKRERLRLPANAKAPAHLSATETSSKLDRFVAQCHRTPAAGLKGKTFRCSVTQRREFPLHESRAKASGVDGPPRGRSCFSCLGRNRGRGGIIEENYKKKNARPTTTRCVVSSVKGHLLKLNIENERKRKDTLSGLGIGGASYRPIQRAHSP